MLEFPDVDPSGQLLAWISGHYTAGRERMQEYSEEDEVRNSNPLPFKRGRIPTPNGPESGIQILPSHSSIPTPPQSVAITHCGKRH